MLVIRLKRIGKKNKPSYRIVVAEHSNAVNGPFAEDLGFYNPHTKTISIDKDAVIGWMNKGAKPSNTVARLLEKEKITHKSVVVIQYHKASKKKEAETKPMAPKVEVAETPDSPTEVTQPTEVAAGSTKNSEEVIEEAPTEVREEAVATAEETPADLPAVALAEEGAPTESIESVKDQSDKTPETPEESVA
ncbi:MAG: 30S ribosomal protein S16 [Patescibacteria group bacterium]